LGCEGKKKKKKPAGGVSQRRKKKKSLPFPIGRAPIRENVGGRSCITGKKRGRGTRTPYSHDRNAHLYDHGPLGGGGGGKRKRKGGILFLKGWAGKRPKVAGGEKKKERRSCPLKRKAEKNLSSTTKRRKWRPAWREKGAFSTGRKGRRSFR